MKIGYIILLIFWVGGAYFLWKKSKEYAEKEKNLQILQKEVHEIERNKIKNEEIEKIKKEAHDYFSQYRQLELDKINLELENEKIDKVKDLDAFAADVVREWHILKDIVENSEKEKQMTLQELEALKEQREQIVQALKREEELRQNREFHSINLSREDKEDIEFLYQLSSKIHKATLINKLIWSEYVMRPYNEMADRVLGKEKQCGIYKITDSISGRSYIGQSSDIRTRWANHLKTALGVGGGAARTRFHDALDEIGIENFTFEVLENCSKDKLNEREKYYINFYETTDFGWNSTKGNG